MKVKYVDHSGSDLLVVNAARASFGKESHAFDDKDAKLINYLAREKHVLPFRHPSLTLRCRAPIFVARQLMKHQAGMSWSEESRRYISTEPEFWWPDRWRKRAENVKQGSSEEDLGLLKVGSDDTNVILGPLDREPLGWEPDISSKQFGKICLRLYNHLLEKGAAPEQARMVLPQNMMITWVWTGSLLAWIHMLKLRLDSHTQKETRDFAGMVAKIVEEKYPISYKALMDN